MLGAFLQLPFEILFPNTLFEDELLKFSPAQKKALIAEGSSLPRSTRLTAVRALGQVASAEAQATLVALIRDADPRVQQETFSALGQSGDVSVLRLLNALAAPDDAAARRQLALARVLIAYRAGLPEPALEPVPRNPPSPRREEPTREVSIDVMSAEQTANDPARFQGPDFSLRFSERADRVRCGRAEWTLWVQRRSGVAAADRVAAQPSVAGLPARWLPPDVAAATQFIVLARPEGGSIRLDIVRTDGRIVYTGTAAPAALGLSFDISDVERPQTAPMALAGVVTQDGVQLDVARVLLTRMSPQRTEPIRVEP